MCKHLEDDSYYKVNVKKLLLCSTTTFKKNSFQTYFNHISLGYRHSGINTLAQTRGGEKRGQAQPTAKILKFG
jgi:hypothetical protein